MASAAVPTIAPGGQAASRARIVSAIQRQGAFIALAALIVFGVVRYGPSFYSAYNIFDAFLNNNTYYALIALGMTFVIITGGIDLSVGSVAVLAAVTAARLSVYGLGPALAGGVLIGLVAGLINGGLIARFGLQPFVVTLAMLLAARGADSIRERAGDGRLRTRLHRVRDAARWAGAIADAHYRGALPARCPAPELHAVRPARAGHWRQRGRRTPGRHPGWAHIGHRLQHER